MSAVVSIERCTGYDAGAVQPALTNCLEHLGGLGRFIASGQRVVLKVNLLSATAPERAITTHPAVVEAVARMVCCLGAHPVIADSPGSVPHTRSGLARAYRATGMLEVAERTGAELNYDPGFVEVPVPEGRAIKRLEVIRPVAEADAVIAIPKFKTHMLTTFTGATKILFGVVPGLAKVGYHGKLPRVEQFSEMLLDVITAVRPALFVMDGVLAMEGDGPGRHGTPRHLGLLLASTDAAAMDVVCCRVVGLDPGRVPTLEAARRRGWWNGDPESIRVLGTTPAEAAITDFRMPATVGVDPRGLGRYPRLQRLFLPYTRQALTPRPVPHRRKCTGCGVCVRSCPQDAVTVVNRVAAVDDRKCIRCYCCHELCPDAAVDLRFSPLGRLIRRNGLLGVRHPFLKPRRPVAGPARGVNLEAGPALRRRTPPRRK